MTKGRTQIFDLYTTFQRLKHFTDVTEKMKNIYVTTWEIREAMAGFGTHIVLVYLDMEIESKIQALKLVRHVCMWQVYLFKSLLVN